MRFPEVFCVSPLIIDKSFIILPSHLFPAFLLVNRELGDDRFY